MAPLMTKFFHLSKFTFLATLLTGAVALASPAADPLPRPLTLDGALSYALAHNRVPVVSRLAITNFGSKSLEEVIQKLDERGLSLRVKE